MEFISHKAAAGIARFEDIAARLEQDLQLYRPLINHLIPLRKELSLKRAPQDEFNVELNKADWPEQYNKGIDMVVGLTIKWI